MTTIKINRAPVLCLWASVVAERLGFDRDEALSLARALTGLTAYAKGVSLGLYQPTPASLREKRRKLKEGEALTVDFMGRAIPVVRTDSGIRALAKGLPVKPESVAGYLTKAFGESLPELQAALERVARSLSPEELAPKAFGLYVKFRPSVPAGAGGWGAKGELDLAKIAALAK